MSIRIKAKESLKLILINLLVLVGIYCFCDLTYSVFRYLFTSTAPDSYGVYEHPGETIRFDPIRGFILTETPSRIARVNYKKVEYVGSYRGNAQGFADRDDFTIKRKSPEQWRVGVLGDSFTTGSMEPFNGPNWPDKVKDLSAESRGRPLETLNFGLDGGGLANWASILRNFIVKEGYDLDGLVIAVAWDDLDRKFAMFDQINEHEFAHARAATWDVNSQPKTRDEALKLLKDDRVVMNRYVVSTPEFDAFVAGRWRPRVWSFRITARFEAVLAGQPKGEKTPVGFEPGQMVLIGEIRQLAGEHSWPVAVVHIPTRDELLDPKAPTKVERTREFAEKLGATFFDGREAFRGLTKQQIKDDWFPVDGHWCKGGSDQFAEYMTAQLPKWLAANAPHEEKKVAKH